MEVLDIEIRNMSILMVENQLLAVSNLNDSNSMSKTDDSSFTQHQVPFQKFLVFSLKKKLFFSGTLMERIKPIVKEELEFEDRDKSRLWERN